MTEVKRAFLDQRGRREPLAFLEERGREEREGIEGDQASLDHLDFLESVE